MFILVLLRGYAGGVGETLRSSIIVLEILSGRVKVSVFDTVQPRVDIAFEAASSSACPSGPFIAAKLPPTLTYGMQYSQRAGRFATALDTA